MATATAPTAAVKTPAPAGTEPLQPPASAAETPARPFRPLPPSGYQISEYAVHHLTVTLPPEVPFEDCLRPEFWANAPHGVLRPADRIDIHSAAGRYYAELYCRAVAASKPALGVKGGAVMAVLRLHEFEPLDRNPRKATHEVRFVGPQFGWSIVRLSDQKIAVPNLADEAEAHRHLAGMIRAGQA